MGERLDVYRDSERVASVPLRGRSLTVGRRSTNDVVLEDLSVSKLHATLERDGERWILEDQGSTNGVVAGGVKVKSAPLLPGKEVKVGCFLLRLALDDASVPGEAASEGSSASREAASEELRQLFWLVGRCASVFHLDELLNTAIDKLLEIFGADRGFILLGTDPEEDLETAVRRGIETTGDDARVSRTIVRRVLESRRPELTSDQDMLPETVDATIRSILCAPLLDGARAFGVVYLDSRAGSRIYDDADRDALETFCAGIAGVYRTAERRERLEREVRKRELLAREEALREHDFRDIVGVSPAIRGCLQQVRAVAPQDVTVLLQGESGTGKELFAKAIHFGSGRRDEPFVAINCMALSPEIIESELFGHEKGAFSGAVAQRIGKLELADGGTVFLDEVGELTHEVQVKLLRVLEEREIQRVGGNRTIPLDVRLVTATNVDLKQAAAEGRFREDLYYRLNVFSLHLPPLRERKEDVPLLVEFFVDHLNEKLGRAVEGVSPEVMRRLQDYDWPGNIRELRNVVERAMVLTRGRTVHREALPFDIAGERAVAVAFPGGDETLERTMSLSEELDMTEARENLERKMIEDALEQTSGNISAAARELGVPRKTVHRKIEQLGIDMTAFGKRREPLSREEIVAALERADGSISAAARRLDVPRTTLYRNMEMFGIDPDAFR